MSWVLVGGLGYERELWERLEKPSFKVVGTAYLLATESFSPAPWAEVAFAEYLTHNYAGLVAESEGILHLSQSLFSCYLAMDLALAYHNPAWIFLPGKPWRLFFLSEKEGGCLGCVEPYHSPPPALVWERFSLDWFDTLAAHWKTPPHQSTLWEGKKTYPLEKNPHCPLHRKEQPYLSGKEQLVVAVSCGENSVAITPSFEKKIDLSVYQEMIRPFVRIRKTNPFFLEIEYERFLCLVFRQGRFIVKGTKEKNTALFLYRQLVGV
ncbi:MAG: hypothetical protein N2314_04780 [Brevinematales bacterium]|nr:hypothetical protein [Brevinematales bacterium]